MGCIPSFAAAALSSIYYVLHVGRLSICLMNVDLIDRGYLLVSVDYSWMWVERGMVLLSLRVRVCS